MKAIRLILLMLFILISFPLRPAEQADPLDMDNVCYQEESVDKELDSLRKEEIKLYTKQLKELECKNINIPKFERIIAYNESRGDQYAINRLGYIGKYQFSMKTLDLLLSKNYLTPRGMTNKQEFLESTWHQRRALVALMYDNMKLAEKNGLPEYINKDVGGVKITYEGILSASHLRGHYSVKKYLRSNGMINDKDANGTSVKDYLKIMI